jgi:ferritin
MLNPTIHELLNQQVQTERQNNAVYVALANELDALRLDGAALYLRKQGREENDHADKITEHVIARGERVETRGLEAVSISPLMIGTALGDALDAALKLEQANTTRIRSLYVSALNAGDPQTMVFLAWAIEEQTNAENELDNYLIQARYAEGCAAAVLALNELLRGQA